MAPDLELQSALLSRLTGAAAFTALCPAANVMDAHGVPARFPSVILGEGQTVRDALTLSERHARLYATLHVWTKSMPSCRAIADAIRVVVEGERLTLPSHHLISCTVESARFLRDPDGETSHGVVTIEAFVEVLS